MQQAMLWMSEGNHGTLSLSPGNRERAARTERTTLSSTGVNGEMIDGVARQSADDSQNGKASTHPSSTMNPGATTAGLLKETPLSNEVETLATAAKAGAKKEVTCLLYVYRREGALQTPPAVQEKLHAWAARLGVPCRSLVVACGEHQDAFERLGLSPGAPQVVLFRSERVGNALLNPDAGNVDSWMAGITQRLRWPLEAALVGMPRVRGLFQSKTVGNDAEPPRPGRSVLLYVYRADGADRPSRQLQSDIANWADDYGFKRYSLDLSAPDIDSHEALRCLGLTGYSAPLLRIYAYRRYSVATMPVWSRLGSDLCPPWDDNNIKRWMNDISGLI